MMDVLRKSLQPLWRSMPMPIRRNLGKAILGTAMPILAARLPAAAQNLQAIPATPSILGVFQAALGHGTAARLLLAELNAAGFEAAIRDVTADVGADVNDLRPTARAATDQGGPLILAINPDTALVALAGRGALLSARPVIGYFVWELEEPPPSWRRIKHTLHGLWSPSQFSANGLSKSFDMPASVVPHPVALAPPPHPTPVARARGRALIGAKDEDFVGFSSFSITSSLARKNPFGAIKAFEAAFGQSQHHKLVLRCLGGKRFPEALTVLRTAVREAKANITLVDAPGGVEELHDLYAACDVLMALHRSEGFGLNMAEAMLSHRAVLATGWSGNMDFMDEDTAALVSYTLTPVQDPQRIYRMRGARWAEPDLDSAVTHLRRLANDMDFRMRLAAAGAAMARAKLSGGAAARALTPWITA